MSPTLAIERSVSAEIDGEAKSPTLSLPVFLTNLELTTRGTVSN